MVPVVEQVSFAELVNFTVREAPERRTENTEESNTVVGILENTEHIDEIDDFLPPIEMLLPFDNIGQSIPSQCI
jgi:hypothetical protein